LGTLARFSSQQLMTLSVEIPACERHTPGNLNRQTSSKV
jgi:hypothetical protein